jgi:hypothetical protein
MATHSASTRPHSSEGTRMASARKARIPGRADSRRSSDSSTARNPRAASTVSANATPGQNRRHIAHMLS